MRIYGAVSRAYLHNANLYHGNCYNTCNKLITIVKNIINPTHIKYKIMHGQWPRWRRNAARRIILSTAHNESIALYQKIERDGYAIMPGRFLSQVESFKASQNIDFKEYPPSMEYYTSQIDLTPEVIDILSDGVITKALELYYGRPPKLRMLPGHNVTHPASGYASCSKSPLNHGWHFDTPNLLQVWVLLTDITMDGTRTLYAKGGHRTSYVNVADWDYHFSEEYIRDTFEVIDCVGHAGTAIIFDSNSPHRIKAVENSIRSTIEILYTPGNHIIKPEKEINLSAIPGGQVRKLFSELT